VESELKAMGLRCPMSSALSPARHSNSHHKGQAGRGWATSGSGNLILKAQRLLSSTRPLPKVTCYLHCTHQGDFCCVSFLNLVCFTHNSWFLISNSENELHSVCEGYYSAANHYRVYTFSLHCSFIIKIMLFMLNEEI
jgi:hypothetical protein